MSLTTQQKSAVKQMVRANGSDAYADAVAASDAFALSELAVYAPKRLSELAVDTTINQAQAVQIAADQQLFGSV